MFFYTFFRILEVLLGAMALALVVVTVAPFTGPPKMLKNNENSIVFNSFQ